MKATLLAILALSLCGCQGIQQTGNQPAPGAMSTGNWEFVLQKSDTQNIYVESNIANTSTAGTYNDHGGGSTLFSLDSSVYLADPASGGGYELGSSVSSFTLIVNSQQEVSAALILQSGSPINFTGTVDPGGMTMSGTFDDGSGDQAPFSASATQGPGGYYYDATDAIGESISSSVITETSQYGSGNYNLMPSRGNFAFLSSDIPTGGNGTIVFWNNSGVCTDNQCAVWFDFSTDSLWILMSNQNPGTSKVIGVLRPPA